MSRALVTGAAGFVGSHFAAHLREQGWDVHGLDIANGPEQDVRRWFHVRTQDRFDLVVHCAAIVGGRAVIESSPLDLAANYEIDAALFGWARRARPGRIVYFSSSAAYPAFLQDGRHRRLSETDIDLDAPQQGTPDALYGRVKLAGEYLARLALAEGLAVSVVRPFSGYGPDQDQTYPFPAFCDRALRREDPFTIWGTGEQVRDWVHVDDIVATVMEMYRLDHNGPLNIGSGAPVTMRQLAQKICAAAGHSPEFETAATAPAGVSWRVCDPSRLHAVRVPRITLEQGIAEALDFRKRFIP